MNLGVNAPVWSPDGNQFTYSRYSPETLTQSNLYTWNVEQQQSTLIREQKPYIKVVDWTGQLAIVEGNAFTRFLTLVLWSQNETLEFSDVRGVSIMPSGEIIFAQKTDDNHADISIFQNGQVNSIAQNITVETYIDLAQY
jgi:hypothetical protein